MTASGISASGLVDYDAQNNHQKIQKELQQLGKDIQSGNLTAAQTDLVTLQQDLTQSSTASASQGSTTASSQSSSPIAQALTQLATDLQSGNTSAAQTDYATIQKDLQAASAQGGWGAHGHHHHHNSQSSSDSSSATSAISQLFTELGQELKAGNLSAAQSTYQSLQQDFQPQGEGSAGQTQPSSTTSSTSLSVNA